MSQALRRAQGLDIFHPLVFDSSTDSESEDEGAEKQNEVEDKKQPILIPDTITVADNFKTIAKRHLRVLFINSMNVTIQGLFRLLLMLIICDFALFYIGLRLSGL